MKVLISKATMFQGEDVTLTFSGSQGIVPILRQDTYRIVHANVSSSDYLSAPVIASHQWYYEPHPSVLTRRWDWPAGKYKVLFIMVQSKLVFGVSTVFEVKTNKMNVLVSKSTIFQGQEVNITFNSFQGIVPILRQDTYRIINANVSSSNYLSAPVIASHEWYYEPHPSGTGLQVNTRYCLIWFRVNLYLVFHPLLT
jgi:hypothetical protein